jgi:RNA polymerase sigma factor for flagellar operon FliA
MVDTALIARRDVDGIVRELAPLVKRIAHHFMAKLPASVEVDDLIQAGLMGLLDAARNFDDGQGAQFETYAVQRIRGSILDELRSADWVPRSVRKNMRRIENATAGLAHQLARAPTETEIAQRMDLPLADYQQMLLDARGHLLLHYEDFHGDEDGADFFDTLVTEAGRRSPLDILEDAGFRTHLIDAIEGLPEREKLVMGLYYERELNLKEIGEVLGVTESRVCQLHSQAVGRLRGRLRAWTANA